MSPDERPPSLAEVLTELRALRSEIREALGLELLTVEQAARLVKASPNAIRQRIHRGQLPTVRVMGNRVRIRRSDLVVG